MQMRAAIVCVVLAAGVAGGSLVLAREPEGQSAVTAEQLIAAALAGEEDKEVNAQLYTFPPGAVLPWHIHPDAHEIAYILEGTLTFQREGEDAKEIKAGEADYLAPNVIHRGMNEGDKPVKPFLWRS